MALSGSTVFEVRTTGSDTNGGSFVTGSSGTDYSLQGAKNTVGSDISTTDAVAVGSSTLTSATGNFSTAIIGNTIYLQGGTGSLAAGWYQVTARASTTSITLDRTVATGTGITMNIGGAMASIGNCLAAGYTTGHIIYVLNGTYSITSATNNVSGGVVSTTASGAIVGYSTNRTLTNTDTRPLIQYGVSGVSLFATRGLVANLSIDGNSQTTARIQGSSDTTTYRGCFFTNINTVSAGSTSSFMGCSATTNSVTIFNGTMAINCEAYANTATPFSVVSITNCLSYGNTGASVDGFNLSATNATARNCDAYNNGRAGFFFGACPRPAIVTNCHAENNTTWGFDLSTAVSGQIIQNCSAYNNTTGTLSTQTKMAVSGFITVTAGSVFTNAASNDFSLNNTVNRGALLRAAGAPTTFPRGLTASYQDIGASQHQDPVSSVVTVASTFS